MNSYSFLLQYEIISIIIVIIIPIMLNDYDGVSSNNYQMFEYLPPHPIYKKRKVQTFSLYKKHLKQQKQFVERESSEMNYNYLMTVKWKDLLKKVEVSKIEDMERYRNEEFDRRGNFKTLNSSSFKNENLEEFLKTRKCVQKKKKLSIGKKELLIKIQILKFDIEKIKKDKISVDPLEIQKMITTRYMLFLNEIINRKKNNENSEDSEENKREAMNKNRNNNNSILKSLDFLEESTYYRKLINDSIMLILNTNKNGGKAYFKKGKRCLFKEIQPNELFLVILDRVYRKVSYITERNVPITEQLVLNLVTDEISKYFSENVQNSENFISILPDKTLNPSLSEFLEFEAGITTEENKNLANNIIDTISSNYKPQNIKIKPQLQPQFHNNNSTQEVTNIMINNSNLKNSISTNLTYIIDHVNQSTNLLPNAVNHPIHNEEVKNEEILTKISQDTSNENSLKLKEKDLSDVLNLKYWNELEKNKNNTLSNNIENKSFKSNRENVHLSFNVNFDNNLDHDRLVEFKKHKDIEKWETEKIEDITSDINLEKERITRIANDKVIAPSYLKSNETSEVEDYFNKNLNAIENENKGKIQLSNDIANPTLNTEIIEEPVENLKREDVIGFHLKTKKKTMFDYDKIHLRGDAAKKDTLNKKEEKKKKTTVKVPKKTFTIKRKNNTNKTIKIIVTDVNNKEIEFEVKTTNNQSQSQINQENSVENKSKQSDLNDEHLEKKLLDEKKNLKKQKTQAERNSDKPKKDKNSDLNNEERSNSDSNSPPQTKTHSRNNSTSLHANHIRRASNASSNKSQSESSINSEDSSRLGMSETREKKDKRIKKGFKIQKEKEKEAQIIKTNKKKVVKKDILPKKRINKARDPRIIHEEGETGSEIDDEAEEEDEEEIETPLDEEEKFNKYLESILKGEEENPLENAETKQKKKPNKRSSYEYNDIKEKIIKARISKTRIQNIDQFLKQASSEIENIDKLKSKQKNSHSFLINNLNEENSSLSNNKQIIKKNFTSSKNLNETRAASKQNTNTKLPIIRSETLNNKISNNKISALNSESILHKKNSMYTLNSLSDQNSPELAQIIEALQKEEFKKAGRHSQNSSNSKFQIEKILVDQFMQKHHISEEEKKEFQNKFKSMRDAMEKLEDSENIPSKELNKKRMKFMFDLNQDIEFNMNKIEISEEHKRRYEELMENLESYKNFDLKSYVENIEKNYEDIKDEIYVK